MARARMSGGCRESGLGGWAVVLGVGAEVEVEAEIEAEVEAEVEADSAGDDAVISSVGLVGIGAVGAAIFLFPNTHLFTFLAVVVLVVVVVGILTSHIPQITFPNAIRIA
jgi:hypothetical protein